MLEMDCRALIIELTKPIFKSQERLENELLNRVQL